MTQMTHTKQNKKIMIKTTKNNINNKNNKKNPKAKMQLQIKTKHKLKIE